MKKQIIIGVDLGGTKIMTGAINQDGKVLGTPVKVATEGAQPKEVILDKIVTSIAQVISPQPSCKALASVLRGHSTVRRA